MDNSKAVISHKTDHSSLAIPSCQTAYAVWDSLPVDRVALVDKVAPVGKVALAVCLPVAWDKEVLAE